jgi:CheY-specific phosphatase CheX
MNSAKSLGHWPLVTLERRAMREKQATIDILAEIFCQAVKKTLEKSTRKEIKYSKTIQVIPKVGLRPEVGCFVQFSGDYNGLVVVNFSAGAALELYRSYMLAMGMPESDLARDSTSAEVVDTMGEMTNQFMGKAMQMVEGRFDLTSYIGQPKALSLNTAITLTPDLDFQDNRRLVFSLENHRFYMEMALERTEFVPL